MPAYTGPCQTRAIAHLKISHYKQRHIEPFCSLVFIFIGTLKDKKYLNLILKSEVRKPFLDAIAMLNKNSIEVLPGSKLLVQPVLIRAFFIFFIFRIWRILVGINKGIP
jgi:hypothetical protein